ncbi:RHS repeat-associated core domain-containing protein [Pelagicoccus sp. SDUM812003]|uniref:RHS repeat-associated core domain-containing protein n=1 Tax=Pelagicoccus sp. SDUM812003 TaxID=3041267 RepID=UPI00280C80AB|nr:RHS repeat-associated core domain-containing protein [Pelagicoccus sp. SDUM812003]MDQ8203358.1 FG-GAP-like repeat-containing protein [Pelagicoccus sp. SDUM812003]
MFLPIYRPHLVLVASIASLFASTAFSAELVGTLGGEVSVDNKGSANYSIPIHTPPGRLGVEPSISLNYSSQGGNGILGVGWGLSHGFPEAIVRGRSILARDGETRGIEFDSSDKFYLDGKRLIVVSGTYGHHGSEYRTEVDSFAKITASGSGDNIDTFTVKTKDGMTLTFGKIGSETDGYQQGEFETQGKAYAYALKRAMDAQDNYVDFDYVHNGHGEYVISKISYTGNVSTGLSPFASVEFVYSTSRLDQPSRYIAERRFLSTHRLDRIDVKFGTEVKAKYLLAYEYSGGNGPTRLVSVTPSHRVPNTSNFDNLISTTFQWEDTAYSHSEVSNVLASPSSDGADRHFFADVNGDGLDDFVKATSTAVKVALSTGNNVGPEQTWATTSTGWVGGNDVFRSCDINADGLADIIFGNPSVAGGKLYALVSTGEASTGFDPLGGGSSPKVIHTFTDEFRDPGQSTYNFRAKEGSATGRRITIADFTGDSRPDILIHRYDGDVKLVKCNGTTYSTAGTYDIGGRSLQGSPSAEPFNVRSVGFHITQELSVSSMPCDLNGDGITDYAWVESQQKPERQSTGPGAWIHSVHGWKEVYAVTSLPEGGFSPRASVANYGWMANQSSQAWRRLNSFYISPGDVNGDGLTDFLTLMPGNVVTEAPWSENQKVLHRTIHYSKGGAGQPKFKHVNMDENYDPTDNPYVNAGGRTVRPWFDKIKQGEWVNDMYQTLNFGDNSQTNDKLSLMLTLGTTSPSDNVMLADLNYDGMQDYVWYLDTGSASTSGWWVQYSLGESFTDPQPAPVNWKPSVRLKSGQVVMDVYSRTGLDLNGDGITDYAQGLTDHTAAAGIDGFYLSSGKPGTRISKIVNGLGYETEIDYSPLTDPLVYTRGEKLLDLYPIRDVMDTRRVVSRVAKDNGSISGATHLKNEFLYTYAGGRTDLSGRGFLGYQAFGTLDYNTGFLSYQFVAQSFPMTGLVRREEVYAVDRSGSSRYFRYMSQTINEVTCDEVVDASGARLGTLYPMINTSRVRKWEFSEVSSSSKDFTVSSDKPWEVQTANGSEPSVNLYSDVSAYTWFDSMTQGSYPLTTPPSIFVNDEGQSGSQTSSGAGVTGGFDQTNDGLGVQRDYDLNDHLGTSTFPAKIKYGHVVKVETDMGEGNRDVSYTTYHPISYFPGEYLPSKVKDSYTVSVTNTGDASYDVTSPVKRYAYFRSGDSIGLLQTETVDATDNVLDISTSYTYIPEGLVKTTSISGYNSSSHYRHVGAYQTSDVISYDSHKRWPLRVENAYDHWTETQREDVYGQPVRVMDTNRNTAAKSTETTYDAIGRPLVETDRLLGNAVTTTRGFITSIEVKPPEADASYDGPDSGGVSVPSRYYETVAPDNQPSVTTYYDFLGRQIRTVKSGYAGQAGTTDTVYDELGRTVASSTLYTSSSDKFWTVNEYDDAGRVYKVTAPNGTVTTTKYHGRVTQVEVDATDRAAQTNTTLVDTRGNAVKVWNADIAVSLSNTTNHYKGIGLPGESIRYDLDGAGRMRQTVLKDTTPTVKVIYDAVGNQSQLDDPDKGVWNYQYNGRGEMVWQKNAKNETTTIAYDLIGRKTSTVVDGIGARDSHSRWHYYEASPQSATNAVVGATGAWIGALQRSEIDNGTTAFSAPDHATSVTYNAKGLPELNLSYVDGKYYYTYIDYDSEWRPFRKNYFWRPSGYEDDYLTQPQLWQKFGVQYTYDSKSYVTHVNDSQGREWWKADPSTGYDVYDAPVKFRKGGDNRNTVGWTTRTYDPKTRSLTRIKTGSHGGDGSIQNWTYAWDGLGNLKSRQSSLQDGNAVETFTYDELNRLETNVVSGQSARTFTYADNGNITYKSGVDGSSSSYTYDASSKPHAVRSAFGYTIGYDANGNMVSRSKSGQTWGFDWTPFDKPNYIVAGSSASLFRYNAENQRVVHVKYNSSTGSPREPLHAKSKKIYVGSQMEVDFDNLITSTGSSGTNWEMSKVRIYIDGPDGRTGAYELDPNTYTQDKVQKGYLYHQDHLGSTDVVVDYVNNLPAPVPPKTAADSGVNAYADDEGGKNSVFSYDPWGERRDPVDWVGKPSATSGANGDEVLTPRGFTDHEMLDNLGLIHMNGRIYDPLLGRFLSADKVVDGVMTLQGWNRYSYLKNNPLRTTDSTGYESDEDKAAREAAERAAREAAEQAAREAAEKAAREAEKAARDATRAHMIGTYGIAGLNMSINANDKNAIRSNLLDEINDDPEARRGNPDKTKELSANYANDPTTDMEALDPLLKGAIDYMFRRINDIEYGIKQSDKNRVEYGWVVSYFYDKKNPDVPVYLLTQAIKGETNSINISTFNAGFEASLRNSDLYLQAKPILYIHTHYAETGGWYQTSSGRIPDDTFGPGGDDVKFSTSHGPLVTTRGSSHFELVRNGKVSVLLRGNPMGDN